MKIVIAKRGPYALLDLTQAVSSVVAPKVVTLNTRHSPAVLEINGGTETDLRVIIATFPEVRFAKDSD
jgi:hypothetical protein